MEKISKFQAKQRAKIFEINEHAASYFAEQFKKSEAAVRYAKERGLTGSIIKNFAIGYAPASYGQGGSLIEHLADKGYEKSFIKEAGLAKETDDGQIKDRFTHRLMFAIKDAQGRIQGFSGRTLSKSDNVPKYLNSPETSVFLKRATLFGLGNALPRIKETHSLILCEGQMDVISLHQASFAAAVATMGTSITQNHSEIISELCDTVYVCYDEDEPGRNACEKAVYTLCEHGVNCRVVDIPSEFKDPDEFIQAKGRESFELCLERAKDGTAFLLERADRKEKQERLLDFLAFGQ